MRKAWPTPCGGWNVAEKDGGSNGLYCFHQMPPRWLRANTSLAGLALILPCSYAPILSSASVAQRSSIALLSGKEKLARICSISPALSNGDKEIRGNEETENRGSRRAEKVKALFSWQAVS